jgi:hypothetical protein
VYGRSSEQTASVFSFGATLVGFTGAYPYDGREAVHSTAFTKSAADFNWSRRPSPFLVDDGQPGSNAGPVVGSLRFLGFAANRSSITSLRLLVSKKLDCQSFAQWTKAARLE